MEEICQKIPVEFEENKYNYYRVCYQKFTGNFNRLKNYQMNISYRASHVSEKPIFNAICIFCNKKEKKKIYSKGLWTTECLSKFEYNGGELVKVCAEKNNDFELLTKIKDQDLFAREAQYHPSCRKEYTRNQFGEYSISLQKSIENVHETALNVICNENDTEVLNNYPIIKFKDLLKIIFLC